MKITLFRFASVIATAMFLGFVGTTRVGAGGAQNAANPNDWPSIPNPYLKSYVGETVKYQHTSRFGDTLVKTTETQTVTHHDGKTMKLKVTQVVGSQEKTETEIIIDLSKEIVIPHLLGFSPNAKIKFVVLASGTATLPIAGKDFEAQWTTYEISGGGSLSTTRRKIWFAKNGPLSGLLKAELFGNVPSVYEMVDFSRKIEGK